MTYYDHKTELKGEVKRLAVEKLKASSEDKIEFGEYTWDSGYCETCSYTEYEFAVLLNGEVVFDSKVDGFYFGGESTFGALQSWLESE